MNDKTCHSQSSPCKDAALNDELRRERLAIWAKAFGHPSRVRIIEILLEQKDCICGDIASQVGSAQSTVSQHLKILKEAGLIQGSIDGPRVCYCVNPETLNAFVQALGTLCLNLENTENAACDSCAPNDCV